MVNETSPLSAAKPLDAYPDEALVRIQAVQRSLSVAQSQQVEQGIAKLFQHFVREGRCDRGQAEVIENGTFIVIAWVGPPLSGCSHDKLNALLAHHQRDGIEVLGVPPISVRSSDGWRHGTRAHVRGWLADGSLAPAAHYLDRTVATMGDWRARGVVPLSASPLRGLIADV
jgi:hypothetical protein